MDSDTASSANPINQSPQPVPPAPQEPIPAPAAVNSPPAPSIATVNPPPENQAKPGKMIWIIAAVVLFLVLAGGGVLGYKYFSPKKTGSIPAALNPGNQTASVRSKYSQDSDSDSIPDLIETGAGLDPANSELTRCQPQSCGTADTSQAQKTQNNILFIIDSSGSMNAAIGGKTKMDLAKDAIRNFVKSASTNVSMGIMVYGEKGSNSSADKAVSCASSEIIAPVGSVSATSVDGYLSQIKPVGWTPIGLSIRNAKSAFSGKEGQKNQIIVVTDGAETCDTNPAGAASEVKTSQYQIQVDVIGFAVSASEESGLRAISTSGGGLFSIAGNSDELLSQMRATHENFEKYQANAQCTANVYQTGVNCLTDVKNKIFSYLTNAMAGKKGSEYQELMDLQTTITKIYNDKINTMQDQWSAAIKAGLQKAN